MFIRQLEIPHQKISILGLTTGAFFLSFVVWFNMAPLTTAIRDSLALTQDETEALLVVNVALAIPARVLIGLLVDRFGPRKVYSSLLVIMSLPCFLFALATTYWQLMVARMALGGIGAGFVIGIRMVSEWFPKKYLGLAEGIYGGWGNFGSAAASMTLPFIALWMGGENGWRMAIGLTGILILVYGIVYFFTVSDTPNGQPLERPSRKKGMEVTSYKSLLGLIGMFIPMYGIMSLLIWQLHIKLGIISEPIAFSGYFLILAVFMINGFHTYKTNQRFLREGIPEQEQYSFKQVAILCFAYFVTFGSELAVVSMLPAFFSETYDIGMAGAGLIAGSFAFTNLVARPLGGSISDRFGRKRVLSVLLSGVTIGYFCIALISPSWPLPLSVVVVMTCSFCVQSGEGAVFAMVPLIKKKITGQIAGMVGAYGSVGSTTFLTFYSFIQPSQFFYIIGLAAGFCTILMYFLSEPETSTINLKKGWLKGKGLSTEMDPSK